MPYLGTWWNFKLEIRRVRDRFVHANKEILLITWYIITSLCGIETKWKNYFNFLFSNVGHVINVVVRFSWIKVRTLLFCLPKYLIQSKKEEKIFFFATNDSMCNKWQLWPLVICNFCLQIFFFLILESHREKVL